MEILPFILTSDEYLVSCEESFLFLYLKYIFLKSKEKIWRNDTYAHLTRSTSDLE